LFKKIIFNSIIKNSNISIIEMEEEQKNPGEVQNLHDKFAEKCNLNE